MDQGNDSLSRAEERLLRALQTRKQRERNSAFLAEGVRVIEDLLEAELPVRLVAAVSPAEDDHRALALLREVNARGIPLRRVTASELSRFAATDTPQGILAVAGTPAAALRDIPAGDLSRLVVALDGIQDPGNLGTIARTAEALGAAGLVILPGTVEPWNPKSVRAAAGSLFRLPVASATWPELANWSRANGSVIFAADAGGQPLPEPLPARAVLLLGNEGNGISAQGRAIADQVVGIPLRGRAESLNVAAAAAILMYQLLH